MAHSSRAKSRPSSRRLPPSQNVPDSKAPESESRCVDAAERHQMIACAAYYRAERRGFSSEGALSDWLAAENEVDALLQASNARPV